MLGGYAENAEKRCKHRRQSPSSPLTKRYLHSCDAQNYVRRVEVEDDKEKIETDRERSGVDAWHKYYGYHRSVPPLSPHWNSLHQC